MTKRDFLRRGVSLLCGMSLLLAAGCGTKAAQTWPLSSEEIAPQPEPASSASASSEPEPVPKLDLERMLAAMTPEQKVGQLFVVSINTTELDDGMKSYFTENGFGNVILFGANVVDRPQLTALTADLQQVITESTGIPAFIGIDQEGGRVTRIWNGATVFPGNMAVCASGKPQNAYQIGKYMGEELKALGVNFNFAPVLDVNSNPQNPVIGNRAYSDDPKAVAEYGVSYIRGLQESGILACGKHFPGHGDTATDSHYGLPIVNKTPDELRQIELYPFSKAIDAGVGGIMSTHILFPAIEKNGLPATMSRSVLTELLREELGFTGLIVSDSMMMDAIKVHFGVNKGCVAAVNAGVELLITGSGWMGTEGDDEQESALHAVVNAVKNGVISEEQLDRTVLHILAVKEELGLFQAAGPAPDALSADWSEHEAFSRAVSDQSITLLHDRAGLLPLSGGKTLFVSCSSTPPAGVEAGNQTAPVFFAERAAQKLGGSSLLLPDVPTQAQLQSLLSAAPGYDTVVFACLNGAQAQLAARVAAVNPRTVAVLLGSPYWGYRLSEVPTALCCYEYTALAADSAIAVLGGAVKASGTLPVKS